MAQRRLTLVLHSSVGQSLHQTRRDRGFGPALDGQEPGRLANRAGGDDVDVPRAAERQRVGVGATAGPIRVHDMVQGGGIGAAGEGGDDRFSGVGNGAVDVAAAGVEINGVIGPPAPRQSTPALSSARGAVRSGEAMGIGPPWDEWGWGGPDQGRGSSSAGGVQGGAKSSEDMPVDGARSRASASCSAQKAASMRASGGRAGIAPRGRG